MAPNEACVAEKVEAVEVPEETAEVPEETAEVPEETAEVPEETAEVPEDQVELFDIKNVIEGFLHRVLDIEECASEFITLAIDNYKNNAERLNKEIVENQAILDNEEDNNKRVVAVKNLGETMRCIERHNNSLHVETLEKSLFISLFSALDKFIGDLVAALYHHNPELYKNINREIPLSEALKYDTITELRQVILEKEIESLRRKSYIEQFKELESKFSIKLTKFDRWPYFIESTQRRNLFTHCDGIVSKQYLDVCRDVNFKFDKEYKVGERLEIGSAYFMQSCMLITEVAVLLGHTLWRKVLPDDLEKADSNLVDIVFNFLQTEQFLNALVLSKFALGLPKISTDKIERIFTVNYAIALKAVGKDGAAKKVLDKKDWSASTYDFKLAYAVLTGDYSEAQVLMNKIGKQGELIIELAYHEWPLFKDFRDSEEFFCGYEEVYGYKYSSKLSSLADDKKPKVEENKEAIDKETLS